MKDPIVDEVRKYRSEHTRRFGCDLADICKDLKCVQAESGYRIVRLRPVAVQPQKASDLSDK